MWGGLIPQEILLQDLNLLKSLVVLGFHLDRSDRSAAAGPTTASNRSDRSLLYNANFDRQQIPNNNRAALCDFPKSTGSHLDRPLEQHINPTYLPESQYNNTRGNIQMVGECTS